MAIQINPEKLAELENITLDRGPHPDFESGHCATEVVAWLAGEGHTDAPSCASRVLRNYTIHLNDRWSDEQRQRLKPYLPRMVGTGDDGKDAARQRIALAHLNEWAAEWVDLADIDPTAVASATTPRETREAHLAARAAAWRKREEAREHLRAKAREAAAEKLKACGKPADPGVVTDVAAVVTSAAGAAALDAIYAAVDAVGAVTSTVVTAAAVVVDAVGVVDAAADAVGAAIEAVGAGAARVDNVVDTAVDAAVNAVDSRYAAVYMAVRDYFRENPFPVIQAVTEIVSEQDGAALDLLDRLITAEEN